MDIQLDAIYAGDVVPYSVIDKPQATTVYSRGYMGSNFVTNSTVAQWVWILPQSLNFIFLKYIPCALNSTYVYI